MGWGSRKTPSRKQRGREVNPGFIATRNIDLSLKPQTCGESDSLSERSMRTISSRAIMTVRPEIGMTIAFRRSRTVLTMKTTRQLTTMVVSGLLITPTMRMWFAMGRVHVGKVAPVLVIRIVMVLIRKSRNRRMHFDL